MGDFYLQGLEREIQIISFVLKELVQYRSRKFQKKFFFPEKIVSFTFLNIFYTFCE